MRDQHLHQRLHRVLNAGNITVNSCSNCVSVNYPISATDTCCTNTNSSGVNLSFNYPQRLLLPARLNPGDLHGHVGLRPRNTTNLLRERVQCPTTLHQQLREFFNAGNITVNSCSNCVSVNYPISAIEPAASNNQQQRGGALVQLLQRLLLPAKAQPGDLHGMSVCGHTATTPTFT